jgi:hypothetical protein
MIAIATALMISFPAAAGLPPRFELPSACEPSWGCINPEPPRNSDRR